MVRIFPQDSLSHHLTYLLEPGQPMGRTVLKSKILAADRMASVGTGAVEHQVPVSPFEKHFSSLSGSPNPLWIAFHITRRNLLVPRFASGMTSFPLLTSLSPWKVWAQGPRLIASPYLL